MFYKKAVLKILQNLQQNTSVGVSFSIQMQACNFIKKETPTLMFSCKFYKNFYRTPPVAASEVWNKTISTYKWKLLAKPNQKPVPSSFCCESNLKLKTKKTKLFALVQKVDALKPEKNPWETSHNSYYYIPCTLPFNYIIPILHDNMSQACNKF